MKSVLSANQTALLGSLVMPRQFLEITVRNRSTGAAVVERLWSDRWTISADVQDPDTGGTTTATFVGAYGMVDMDAIPRVANLIVQRIDIRMLAFGVDTDRILRAYDPHQAKIRIWRGFLNTETRRLVAAAEPLFFGFVDGVELPTPSEGAEGYATLTCVSHTQEATRANPEKRSDASQRLRSATDNFFQSAATVGEQTYFWGSKKDKVDTVKGGTTGGATGGSSSGR